MLKDLLRRKLIVERATLIASEIMKRYPPDLDAIHLADSKSDLTKKQRKLVKALQLGKADISRTIGELKLGVYGKAKCYKTVQDAMLSKGYTEGSARIIIEELLVTF